MAKSKKSRSVQVFISPENYIRKKARNLPISSCLINTDWNERGVSTIIVSRQHINGNQTFGMYLVDKDCLGVKDTFFNFNIPAYEFNAIVRDMNNQYKIGEISYELAHNIIFAAIEYAEEYGFKPHKDFTSTTQYLLEEDNDDIPLIEIHCGNKDGNPRYINNGYESPADAKKIISQLEKTAGKGNFEILINVDTFDGMNRDNDDDYDDDYDDDDDVEDDDYDQEEESFYDGYYKEFTSMDEVEIEQQTLSIFKEYKEICDNQFCPHPGIAIKTMVLADYWLEKNNIINMDVMDKYRKIMETDLVSIKTVEIRDVPNSFFPTFTYGGQDLEDDFYQIFGDISDTNAKNQRQAESQISQFAQKYGDCGAVSYLKLMLKSRSKLNILKEIEKELGRFPDYFILQILQKERAGQDMSSAEARKQLTDLLKGKKITHFEMTQFITLYAILVFDVVNRETDDRLEKIEALRKILHSLDCFETTGPVLTMQVGILHLSATVDRFFKNR